MLHKLSIVNNKRWFATIPVNIKPFLVPVWIPTIITFYCNMTIWMIFSLLKYHNVSYLGLRIIDIWAAPTTLRDIRSH